MKGAIVIVVLVVLLTVLVTYAALLLVFTGDPVLAFLAGIALGGYVVIVARWMIEALLIHTDPRTGMLR